MSQNLKSYVKGSPFPSLTPGTLRLYSMRFCPYAQRTRLVLEHKGIQYETINVSLKEKPEWFLERNPMGLVPVLERDGKVVYESLICDDYLEELYPEPRLTPSDPYLKAKDRILMQTFDKFTTDVYGVIRSRGENKEAGEKLMKAAQRYEDALQERGDFFGGDKVSMVDFTVWPWFERTSMMDKVAAEYCITKDKFPHLSAWLQRMYELPAVKATMFDVESHLAFVVSFASGNPQYDYGL